MVGVGERVAFWVEGVRVEEMQRVVRELVGVPRQDPLVVNRIGRVVAREPSGSCGERPRVRDGEQDEQGERRQRKRPILVDDPRLRLMNLVQDLVPWPASVSGK